MNDTRDAQEHQKELEEREQWELWLKSDPAFQEWLDELDKFLDKGEDDDRQKRDV